MTDESPSSEMMIAVGGIIIFIAIILILFHILGEGLTFTDLFNLFQGVVTFFVGILLGQLNWILR